MKYENARDILPAALFAELQRYAAGKLLYVPSPSARRPWGFHTGYRRQLDERNGEIRKRYASGISAESLADEYFLTPETVRKIVYQKKEKEPMEIKNMELEDILKLYADGSPVRVETVAEGPVYDRDNGTGYYLELRADYASGKLTVHVCDYAFASPERIAQCAAVIEAYRSLGCACPRIRPDNGGRLSGTVRYKDRGCIVFAQEYAGERYLSGCPVGDGLPPYHDELLVIAAKMASLRLEGREASAFELFDPITACGDRYEDYTAEYVYGDLKNQIMEQYPALTDRYERITELFAENRNQLRRLWGTLPASLFHGELCEICVDEEGHFQCFTQFCEGGRETCIGYFIRLAFFLYKKAGKIANGCDEVYDEGIRSRRLEAFRRDFRLLSRHYRFTDAELEAAPLIYKNLLLGTYYYWNVVEFAGGGESRLADFLDHLEKQLTAEELDFAAILR